jgi:transcriptional antiterminator NusG
MSELFGNSQKRCWYIVQTYSEYEHKVQANLEQRIASMEMNDRIFRVLVPMVDKVTVKDGKTRQTRRKLFPGYVLVEMILEDQSWYVVRHTPGVTGFVGSGNHPIPLTPKEVDEIMSKLSKEAKPKLELNFKVGEKVRVNTGPFLGQVGPVIDIDEDKGKIKISLSVFGRETVVEADYLELERI